MSDEGGGVAAKEAAEELCQHAGSWCCAALGSWGRVSGSLYSAPSTLLRRGKQWKDEIHPHTDSR